MKDALDGKVKRVAVSSRLSDTPSCVTAEGPITLEMEKILAAGLKEIKLRATEYLS